MRATTEAGDNPLMQNLHKFHLILVIGLIFPALTVAAPAAQPGDVGLRHDIQVLADYGAISGPVTTWPISWDALLADLELIEANDVVLPNKVIPTFDRTLARARRETTKGQHSFNARVAAAEKPAQIRGFSDTPRGRGEIQAGYSWLSDRFTVDLNASYVNQPADGEEARADGSQIGVDFGNWSVAASTLDRWWGPGWDGSLILSNNARPIPSLTLGRNKTQAFKSKWLSWIGPWGMNVIFGQLEEEREGRDHHIEERAHDHVAQHEPDRVREDRQAEVDRQVRLGKDEREERRHDGQEDC